MTRAEAVKALDEAADALTWAVEQGLVQVTNLDKLQAVQADLRRLAALLHFTADPAPSNRSKLPYQGAF